MTVEGAATSSTARPVRDEPPRSQPPPGLLWRALLDGAFDSIVLSTLEGKVVLASDSFFDLTGYEPDEIVGRTSTELGLVEADVHRQAVEQVRREGRSGAYESALRTADGALKHVEFTVQLVGGYLLSIVRDVTARRRTEETARRLSAVAEAALSHLAMDELLDDVVVRVRELLGADRCGILLFDEEAGELVRRGGEGRQLSVPIGRGLIGRAAAERRLLALEDGADAEIPGQRKLRTAIAAPLVAGDRVLAVIYAGNRRRRRFTTEEQELLRLAAARAALGLERSLLASELRQVERLRQRLSPRVWDRLSRP